MQTPQQHKILLWHGYLLGGTGSNVYTRSLARAWARSGHDVVVFCQEPHPERFDLGGARVVRPHAGRLLPVFVLDRYEDMESRLLQEMEPVDVDAFVDANAAAVRAELPADFVLANHVLLGGPVGAASGAPFAVKAHGSELEFSIRGSERLAAWARETLDRAEVVFAGSEHIRRVLAEVVGPGPYLERTRIVPPGVDVEFLRPEPRDEALACLLAEARRDVQTGSERDPDPENAARFERFFADERPTVAYVGKLSAEKGVSLLLQALAGVDAKAVVVGFGPARSSLEDNVRCLAPGQVLLTGPLEHRHLVHLWNLADVSVTPSVFPEAFGMVAAEAAACGSLPLVARHSGLAEIAEGLESEYPPAHRELASFAPGDVADLAAKLGALLALPRSDWLGLSRAARRAVVGRWSWDRVAALLLSADGRHPAVKP